MKKLDLTPVRLGQSDLHVTPYFVGHHDIWTAGG